MKARLHVTTTHGHATPPCVVVLEFDTNTQMEDAADAFKRAHAEHAYVGYHCVKLPVQPPGGY